VYLRVNKVEGMAIHKEKSNNMQQCIKLLLFHIYMKLDMFRALSGTVCLTMFISYTSNNLPRMKKPEAASAVLGS
jgi:hypothetical protein